MEVPQRLMLIVDVLVIGFLVNVGWSKLEVHLDKHHDDVTTPSSISKGAKDERIESENHAKLYRSALKLKRREQLNAVKTIIAIDNANKRKTLILDLINGMHKVMDEAKQLIEKGNFTVGDPFPFTNTQLKEAVCNIIENTAFFCEFALRFPSIVGKKYWNDYKLRSTIDWAYKFSQAVDLYDEAAQKLLHLTGQELNIIPREENFVNPYDKKYMKEEIEREAVRRMDEAKEKKIQQRKIEKMKKKERKPTLTKTEL